MRAAAVAAILCALAAAGVGGEAASAGAAQGQQPAGPTVRQRVVRRERLPEEKGLPPVNLEEAAPHKYESVHFTLYTEFSDDEYAVKLQGDLERYFSRLQKEFWDFIRPEYREAHIVMAVFERQEAFDALAEKDGAVPRGERGYSSRTADRIAFVRQDEYYKDVTIVVHEMVHLFNRFSLGETPVWIDEGMAQFYACYAGEEKGNPHVKGGVSPAALNTIDAALKEGRLRSIASLLQMDDATFYGQDSEVNYAESWALVFYLRRGMPGGDETLGKYYEVVVSGGDYYEAFMRTYGEFAALEAAWLDYLAKLHAEQTGAAGAVESGTKAGSGEGQ